MRQARIEIYRSRDFVDWDEVHSQNVYRITFRWQMRAGNGRIVSESGEGYTEPRNLVRGLEIAHPGWELARDSSAWGEDLGWELRSVCDDWNPIPVTVPTGTGRLWRARRR